MKPNLLNADRFFTVLGMQVPIRSGASLSTHNPQVKTLSRFDQALSQVERDPRPTVGSIRQTCSIVINIICMYGIQASIKPAIKGNAEPLEGDRLVGDFQHLPLMTFSKRMYRTPLHRYSEDNPAVLGKPTASVTDTWNNGRPHHGVSASSSLVAFDQQPKVCHHVGGCSLLTSLAFSFQLSLERPCPHSVSAYSRSRCVHLNTK